MATVKTGVKSEVKKHDGALNEFLNDLGRRVVGELRTDQYSRMLYSTDASLYQVMPYGVLIPKDVEDVHAAVELSAKYKIPIVPRAGGSSLAGQSVNEALIIDMSRRASRRLVRCSPALCYGKWRQIPPVESW